MKIATDITKEAEIIMKDYKVLDAEVRIYFYVNFHYQNLIYFFYSSNNKS